MKVLFVDDRKERWDVYREKNPDTDTLWVKNVNEALDALIDHGKDIEKIWLDYDIGEQDDPNHPTFYPVAQAIILMNFKGKIRLHSHNDAGRARQFALMKSHDLNVKDKGSKWGE